MQVTPINTILRAAAAGSSDSTTTTTPAPSTNKQVLGQEDFLKLLAVQFQNQDPMQPMDDTAFIAQMAQFTALDQSSSMLQQMTQLGNTQAATTANSYIGRSVTLDTGNGTTTTGDVTGVDLTTGTPLLIVGDTTYPLSAVLRVEPGTTPTAAPTATATSAHP